MRKKTSIIWLTSKEEYIKLVASKNSISDIVRHLGLNPSGGCHGVLSKRLKSLGIDLSIFKEKQRAKQIEQCKKMKRNGPIPLENVLVQNSTYNRGSLKIRLIKLGYLENKCAKCSIGPIWEGLSLSLQLDHINGINNDNRLENLQILCPNCHSQTSTYAGKKVKIRKLKRIKIEKKCSSCSKKISQKSKKLMCFKCHAFTQRKTIRPDIDIVESEVKLLGYSAVGRKYGVSDNAIRKWLKLK